MGRSAKNDVTGEAQSVAKYCAYLQKKSGFTVKEFAKKCGMSENYWYIRARFDAPLTLSDCERIAKANHMNLKTFFINALNHGIDPETGQRVYDPTAAVDEQSKVAATLAKAQRGSMDLAALHDDNKQALIDGEAGPDYDDPA